MEQGERGRANGPQQACSRVFLSCLHTIGGTPSQGSALMGQLPEVLLLVVPQHWSSTPSTGCQADLPKKPQDRPVSMCGVLQVSAVFTEFTLEGDPIVEPGSLRGTFP